MTHIEPWKDIEECIQEDRKDMTLVYLTAKHAYQLQTVRFGRDHRLRVGRTLVEYGSFEDCSTTFEATKQLNRFYPIKHQSRVVEEGQTKQELVYDDVFVSWSEWLQILAAYGAILDVTDIGMYVFSQVVRRVRSQLMSKKESFADLEHSFGVTEENKLVFVKPANAGNDFDSNIRDLSRMADDLRVVLGGANGRKKEVDLLKGFHIFINNGYLSWPTNIVDEYTRQCLAVNHPVYFKASDTFRFFNNMGRLGDREQERSLWQNLGDDPEFQREIRKRLSGWRHNIAGHPIWGSILVYDPRSRSQSQSQSQSQSRSQSQPQWKYRNFHIVAYIINALKHYWNHASGVAGKIKLSKEDIILELEKVIPDLACTVYSAYARAVVFGYEHDTFDMEKTLKVIL